MRPRRNNQPCRSQPCFYRECQNAALGASIAGYPPGAHLQGKDVEVLPGDLIASLLEVVGPQRP